MLVSAVETFEGMVQLLCRSRNRAEDDGTRNEMNDEEIRIDRLNIVSNHNGSL